MDKKEERDAELESSDSSESESSSDSSSDSESDSELVKKVEKKPVKKVIEKKPEKKVEVEEPDDFEDLDFDFVNGTNNDQHSKKEESDKEESDKEESDKEESDKDDSDKDDSDKEDFEDLDFDVVPEKKSLKIITPCLIPFMLRKTFPFCFWYIYNTENIEDIEKLKFVIFTAIMKLIDPPKEFNFYFIKGNREKDRIRVICPEIIVSIQLAKDLRSLILSSLGYKSNANIIPALMFEIPIIPTVLVARAWDMGISKWESYQTYKCFLRPELKTEEIERNIVKWSALKGEVVDFTDKYKEFLAIRNDDNNFDSVDNELAVLEETNMKTFSICSDITPELKKKVGADYKKCVDLFKKYHPDAGLRGVRTLENNVFLFDFTKSKHTCKLCDVAHQSNRQYLTYSKKSQKAFYHCYDTDASDKRHVVCFKKRRGSDVVTLE